ncbi:MAG: hypothetical protein Kow00108_03850 [Calditrichia bacterium]
MTPLDEKKIREEIRHKIEEEFSKRSSGPTKKDDDLSRKELLLREKIRKEEEERFYTQKGLVKYKNKFGEIEWLSPEEADRRKNRRKRKKKKIKKVFTKVRRNLLEFIILLVLMGIVYFVYKFYSGKSKIISPTSTLSVETNIDGAAIYLDGKFTNSFTPGNFPDVKPGHHWILVQKPGYLAIPGFMYVNVSGNQRSTYHFHLIPGLSTGTIELINLPEETRIFADGQPVYKTNRNTVQLTEGWHAISVYHPDYEINPQVSWIHVDKENVSELHFSHTKIGKYGKLTITSSVSDIKIFLNNKFIGFSPSVIPYNLVEGSYKIQALHPFYRFQPKEFLKDIRESTPIHIAFTLARDQKRFPTSFGIPDYISLHIDAFPYHQLEENQSVNLVEGEHHLTIIDNKIGIIKEQNITVNRNTQNNFKYNPTMQIFERIK